MARRSIPGYVTSSIKRSLVLPVVLEPPGVYPYNQKGVQAPGANPHDTLQVQNRFQQPLAVIPTAPPMSPSPVPQQSQRPLLSSQNEVIDPQTRGELTNLLKNLGGQFLYLCRFCFDDAPQVFSVQNSSNPDICTGRKKATSGKAPTDASCTGCARGARIATGKYESDPMEFQPRHSSAGIATSLMGALLEPSAVLLIMRYSDTIVILCSLFKFSFKNSTDSLMMPEKLKPESKQNFF